MAIRADERRAAVMERLAELHESVAGAVEAMPDADPTVAAQLRGLYITDQQARVWASEPGRPSLAPSEPSTAVRNVAAGLGLDDDEFDTLVLAAAPDVDARYERIYGYLNDDVTRRRLSIGLAIGLLGGDVSDPDHRIRFDRRAPLLSNGLVALDDPSRPFLTRGIQVHDEVVDWLLGGATPWLIVARPADHLLEMAWLTALSRTLVESAVPVYVVDGADGVAADLAAMAVARVVGRTVEVDFATESDHVGAVETVIRRATIADAGIVARSVDRLTAPGMVDRLSSMERVTVLCGRVPWDPERGSVVPLTLEAPMLDAEERAALWRSALAGLGLDADPSEAATSYRLTPRHIERAAQAALALAAHDGRTVQPTDLQYGARIQNSTGLARLSQRIVPVARWDDLIVPDRVRTDLQRLTSRVRNHHLVLDAWQLRRGGGRGDGLTAMFAGPSGTGKTLAAEVVAGALGLDVHVVDLATVVDKYIGETEKNLDRIFTEAQRMNTVLFFDEADALFGKRSEVKDARDRYANVEVAYLLQRMERFAGLCVLATNLVLNIDEAFSRRLDIVINFPKPVVGDRCRLWTHLIGRALPLAADVDLDFLARSFDLSGGDIRNAVVGAAYRAADDGQLVTMRHLVYSVADEYEKLGRLCLESDFDVWHAGLDARHRPDPLDASQRVAARSG